MSGQDREAVPHVAGCQRLERQDLRPWVRVVLFQGVHEGFEGFGASREFGEKGRGWTRHLVGERLLERGNVVLRIRCRPWRLVVELGQQGDDRRIGGEASKSRNQQWIAEPCALLGTLGLVDQVEAIGLLRLLGQPLPRPFGGSLGEGLQDRELKGEVVNPLRDAERVVEVRGEPHQGRGDRALVPQRPCRFEHRGIPGGVVIGGCVQQRESRALETEFSGSLSELVEDRERVLGPFEPAPQLRFDPAVDDAHRLLEGVPCFRVALRAHPEILEVSQVAACRHRVVKDLHVAGVLGGHSPQDPDLQVAASQSCGEAQGLLEDRDAELGRRLGILHANHQVDQAEHLQVGRLDTFRKKQRFLEHLARLRARFGRRAEVPSLASEILDVSPFLGAHDRGQAKPGREDPAHGEHRRDSSQHQILSPESVP